MHLSAPNETGRGSRLALEWLLLAGVMAVIAGMAVVDLRASHRARLASQKGRIEHQSLIVEKMIATRLDGTGHALDLLRADYRALGDHPTGLVRLNERMEAMAASTAGVRSIVLVSRDGRTIASNRKELIGIDFRGSERFRIISANPDPALLFISAPFLSPLKNWVLSLGRAVVDDRGAFDGYVLAIIDPDYFNLLLDSTRYAPDMTSGLVHSGGMVVFRVPGAPPTSGENLSAQHDSPFSRHVRIGGALSTVTAPLESTGKESLIVFRDVRPAGHPSDGYLVAELSRDMEAILAPWRSELRDRVTVVAILAVASAAGLLVYQRRRATSEREREERDAERRAAEASRAALQAQLAQAQKLESIGRLAGGVAHDFNNLLTVILSFADDGLSDVRDGKLPAPACLEEIKGAALRAATLTQQLLAFARKQVIQPVTLDLGEHVRTSGNLLRRAIGEDVRVEERLQAGLWPVRCDPGLLGQVVLNLAVNARDAMPGGGKLTLSTENVTFVPGDALPAAQMEPGDYVRLAVDDTGTGMTPDVIEHLFEPFFTTKTLGKGTGLGLATVYGIVRQSGAFMQVRSEPGRGSTFSIYFPRADGKVEVQAPVPARRPGGSETVLVVEDDPAVREVVVQVLRTGGYHVLAAANAAEALDMAVTAPRTVDLVLTDLVLPGGSGVDAARRVAERFPGVRVLYMSGHGHDLMEGKGVDDPAGAFVPKPFTADALRARVREVLDAPRPLPQA
jgi:signal transduction histidine kinase/ActR/RegA family two-component response regulator